MLTVSFTSFMTLREHLPFQSEQAVEGNTGTQTFPPI
jgi:hypothetical protein